MKISISQYAMGLSSQIKWNKANRVKNTIFTANDQQTYLSIAVYKSLLWCFVLSRRHTLKLMNESLSNNWNILLSRYRIHPSSFFMFSFARKNARKSLQTVWNLPRYIWQLYHKVKNGLLRWNKRLPQFYDWGGGGSGVH